MLREDTQASASDTLHSLSHLWWISVCHRSQFSVNKYSMVFSWLGLINARTRTKPGQDGPNDRDSFDVCWSLFFIDASCPTAFQRHTAVFLPLDLVILILPPTNKGNTTANNKICLGLYCFASPQNLSRHCVPATSDMFCPFQFIFAWHFLMAVGRYHAIRTLSWWPDVVMVTGRYHCAYGGGRLTCRWQVIMVVQYYDAGGTFWWWKVDMLTPWRHCQLCSSLTSSLERMFPSQSCF